MAISSLESIVGPMLALLGSAGILTTKYFLSLWCVGIYIFVETGR